VQRKKEPPPGGSFFYGFYFPDAGRGGRGQEKQEILVKEFLINVTYIS
jgi:hypothetical protein